MLELALIWPLILQCPYIYPPGPGYSAGSCNPYGYHPHVVYVMLLSLPRPISVLVRDFGLLLSSTRPAKFLRSIGKRLTIQQLINKHKIILDTLFVKLAKICFPQSPQPLQELKHQCCVRIAFRDRDQIYVLMSDVGKGCRPEGQYGRPDVDIGNDLDSKYVREARATIGSE